MPAVWRKMQPVTVWLSYPTSRIGAAGRSLDNAVMCTNKGGRIDRDCNQSAISKRGVLDMLSLVSKPIRRNNPASFGSSATDQFASSCGTFGTDGSLG